MNKKYLIRKNLEFQEIIKSCKNKKSKLYVIYYRKNNNNYNRYGISVGKKVGNAVIRNKLKRQIKDILRKNTIEDMYYCMI